MSMQRRFVADAAHELRSPVTALVVQAENLERGLVSVALDDDTRRRLALLKSGLHRARSLLEQMLVFARLQNGMTAPAGTVVLQAAAREAVEGAFVLADSKRIGLTLTDDAPGLRVDGAQREIVMLLSSLIGNAVRYTPEGGAVAVRLSHHDDAATIDVIDSGPGIPADKRTRVFDAFYRATDQRDEGTGLGLAIVLAIVSRLGGTVQLNDASPTPPHGLHARVTLPNASGVSHGAP